MEILQDCLQITALFSLDLQVRLRALPRISLDLQIPSEGIHSCPRLIRRDVFLERLLFPLVPLYSTLFQLGLKLPEFAFS